VARRLTTAQAIIQFLKAQQVSRDSRNQSPLSQGEGIGVLNSMLGPKDVIVCAAGSPPRDLHQLWRTRDPKGYHLEYAYS
jgi:3D-(3,5/4)-trihydroxycyclohexane-1,2-dione acylhydrolase (decyclizing)